MAPLRRSLYAALPQHALSRIAARVARWDAGRLTSTFIRWFVGHYGVDLSEAAEPDPGAYPSFAAFFTRTLAAGSRPTPPEPNAVASPVDGVVSACGRIYEDTVFQAKGRTYFAAALLGSVQAAGRYRNGRFITLYLRPRDYHRVHAPLSARLTHIRHLPGRLWPLRPWTVAAVDGLFARNERAVLEFSAEGRPYALVMVGALMVGGLQTRITGPMQHAHSEPAEWNLETSPVTFERGEEVGRFNFGSTVILLFPPAQIDPAPDLAVGRPVRLGQRIATTHR